MPRRGIRSPVLVAARIAGIYAIFSVLWIVYSDRFVAGIATTQEQVTFLQTIKGGGFVVASSVILFGLVYREHREQVTTNEELDSALQQVHILHRILRHDLRNVCMIIGGKIDKLEPNSHRRRAKAFEVLRRQNERLLNLSQKSRYFRHFLSGRTGAPRRYDLVETVHTKVDAARDRYANARFHVETPASAPVIAHHLLGRAVEELIENAIVHNPAPDTNVWITVESDGNRVTLAVEDDGPGIPQRERSTLTAKYETPLEHSRGLGLWLVQLTTNASDGQFKIRESDHGGASTRLELPTVQS